MRLPLLTLHILGGSIGLLSGTFAMAVRKGSRLHRASRQRLRRRDADLGLKRALPRDPQIPGGNIIGSIITFYLIATAWLAGHRRDTGRLEWAALVVGIGGAAAILTLAIRNALHRRPLTENAPAGMCLLFGSRPPASRRRRYSYANSRADFRPTAVHAHLWRMCFGLFIATALSSSASNKSFLLSCAARSC